MEKLLTLYINLNIILMRNTLILLISFLLFSCTQNKVEDEKVLQVTLEETPVSVKDLFSSVEVIPLETNDSCLLARITRIREVNGNFYLLSEDYPVFQHIALMMFDGEGHFVRSIGKVGQGPEEYPWLIYDAAIDADKQLAYMMSPAGSIYIYHLDGSFVRKMAMPQKMNYQRLDVLDGNTLLGWSALEEDESSVTLAKADSGTLVNEFWKDEFELNWDCHEPFYQYDNETYFASAHRRKVYRVTKDSLALAYQWDFGKDNIDIEKQCASLSDDRQAASEEWRRKKDDGSIPYFISMHGQTSKYYYACLFHDIKNMYNLFYEKKTGKALYFKETTEGIDLSPQLITNEYMLMLVNTESLEKLAPVLGEKEYAKIADRVEDENPCLVKFLF